MKAPSPSDRQAAYDWGKSVGSVYRTNKAPTAPNARGTGLRGPLRLLYDSGAIAGFTDGPRALPIRPSPSRSDKAVPVSDPYLDYISSRPKRA